MTGDFALGMVAGAAFVSLLWGLAWLRCQPRIVEREFHGDQI